MLAAVSPEFLKICTPMFRNPDKASKWLALVLFLACLKLIMFIYDSNPEVFLGDSGSYLLSALMKLIPPDRSFLYGFVVRFIGQNSHSLSSLIAIQTVAGIGTSLLVAVILVRFFRTNFKIAAVIAAVLTLEPQQLLFERFVLTESISTAWFALLMLLALEYLRRPRLWVLAVLQPVGVILIAFRLTFLPAVMTATVAVPLFGYAGSVWDASSWKDRKRILIPLALHLSLSILMFTAWHTAYKNWNGWLSSRPPAYSYSDGFFLISNVSPLVTPADTDNPELIPVLARPLVHAKDPLAMDARNSEMFADEGLVSRIQKALKDDDRANVESKRIAYSAIRRDPVGFLRLALRTYLKFFSRDYMQVILQHEAGMSPIDPGVLKLLAFYHLDAEDLAFTKSITKKYHLASWPYYVLLANTPLVLLLAVFVVKQPRAILWFSLLITSVHTAATQILGVEPSPRHLHAASVMLAIGAGILAARVWRTFENSNRV